MMLDMNHFVMDGDYLRSLVRWWLRDVEKRRARGDTLSGTDALLAMCDAQGWRLAVDRLGVPGRCRCIEAGARVVTLDLVQNRINACPMEPRAAVAEWGEDGAVTIWTKRQG